MNDSDRRIVADLSQWIHDAGWHDAGWRGFQNARCEDAATTAVRLNETGFQVWRKTTDAPHFTGQPVEYPADSVREAVDMLVALDILPARFSSLADTMRKLADELETEAAVHDAPASTMFLDAGFRIRQTVDGEYAPSGDLR